MTKPDICIYHGKCADGFTAAWAVWKRFGDSVEYVQGIYGQDPPDVTGKHVVIVDFSYKRPVLEEMGKHAASILVLDHHKSAQEDLGDYPPPITPNSWENHIADVTGIASDGTDPRTPRAVFDMDRSGAGITWDYFHPSTDRPPLIGYVEDRDLWKFNLPNSREVNAFIFAHEYTFSNWCLLDDCIATNLQKAVDGGAAIEKKHHKDVAELVAVLKRDMMIGGCRVPVANLPYTLTSDAGHLMCSQMRDEGLYGAGLPPFAACYWDTPKGRVFSLRSLSESIDPTSAIADVSEIAKQYGGGGHKNAAGFTMPIGWEGE